MKATTRNRRDAFTLVEMMVSLCGSAVILSALLVSSISLQRSLQDNERSAGAYSDQRRLTDYLSRDLRRAVAVEVTDDNGVRSDISMRGGAVTIANRATAIFSLPGYYRSNVRTDSEYDDAFAVVGAEDRLDYGNADGLAATVEVVFRRVYTARENCVCFVRQEAGTEITVVRKADNLTARVSVSEGGQTGFVKTSYRSTLRNWGRPLETYDQLLLRNPPLLYRP